MYSSSPVNDSITDVDGPSSLALAPPQAPRMTTATDTEAIPLDSISRSHSPTAWSSGLCDCGRDLNSCCLTCWCPCIAFGRIAEMVDGGSTACGVSGIVYEMMMRLFGGMRT